MFEIDTEAKCAAPRAPFYITGQTLTRMAYNHRKS